MNWWDRMNFVNDSFLNFCWRGEEIQLKSWPRHYLLSVKMSKLAPEPHQHQQTRERHVRHAPMRCECWVLDGSLTASEAKHILSIISAYCRGLLQCFMQKIWGWGKADLVITGIFCSGWNIFSISFLQHDKNLLIKPPTKQALSWTWGNVSG